MRSAAGTDMAKKIMSLKEGIQPADGKNIRIVRLSDGRTISYRLTRKKIKNAYFRAKADGIVDVSANSRMTIAQVEQFIRERADYFLKALEDVAAKAQRNIADISRVQWLGKEYSVRVIESSRECAVLEENECRVFTRFGDEENICSLVRRMTAERFAVLCGELNEQVRSELEARGLTPPPTRITIKEMTSRWGSCSYSKGHISMNIRLAPFPRETVLSVLWHEYAHYWHHDHSKKFYEFVLEMYPEYYKWNNLLK